MPRNVDKVRCSVPGCHNWAMRGQARCRAHRNNALGPGRVGAPSGNLNALRHGRYSHPLSLSDLQAVAHRLVDSPGDLPLELARLVQSCQERTGDPFLALLALRQLLPSLVDLLAARRFEDELQIYLAPMPPAARARVERLLRLYAARVAPEEALRFLKKRMYRKNSQRNRVEP